MTTQSYAMSAYGVIIRNSEHDTLHRISEKFSYGEEEIDHSLPASDVLDGEIDLAKLDEKFPGLSADVAGEILLEMNRSLVVFISSSRVHAAIEDGKHDAWKLPEHNVTKASRKALKKFCKKYKVTEEPGWITWSATA